ncbi:MULTISPECIES: glycosyltransferase family 4 protein [unclassified Microcoleus]|uniref:glycosyltransferase family 4 protein n=1 Tax=unclassified Microcoleus TaxID=2642155 RepID=UPI002FD0A731
MRLTLLTSSLSCGGAERAAILIAEGLLKKGHQVSFVTIAGTERDFYKVPDGVHRLALDLAGISPTPFHALWNNLYRLRVLRQTIRALQPDAVISFMAEINILTLLALTQTNYPVIVNEQNNPDTDTQNLWKQLRRWIYPRANKVVSVSEGVDNYFDDWLPKTQRAVIFNPLQPINGETGTFDLPQGADPNKKWAIAMGRLVYQKNFELLLSAFHKIIDRYPDWQLLIFGEGEMRKELEHLRDHFGLGEQVLLPGQTKNPIAVFKSSQLFILSSRWEGLPAVLFEALACGLPVVSTDCPSGPREIIRDGVDGILVPTEDMLALATAMDSLMSDEEKRTTLAARAPEVKERFSLEKIVEKWEELLKQIVEVPR